jgi:CheY-like chemotaxis protein
MGGPVLVVDDDPDLREALRLILEAYGLTARVANDPQQALRWLSEEALPAVVLLDMRMPGMSGEEFLWALQGLGLRGRVPVVVLSGDATARATAEAAGASEFLAKPVEVQELLATLMRWTGTVEMGAP